MIGFCNKYFKIILIIAFSFIMGCASKEELPPGFVYLSDIDPSIIEFPRFKTDQNFMAKNVAGYDSHRIVCTKQAAEQLKLANTDFKKMGYTVVVYDGYRPQRAVNEFIRWSQDEHDQTQKNYYYPKIDKKDFTKLGYVAEKSSHSRGSSFDITLIRSDEPYKWITVKNHTLTNGEVIPYLDDNTVDMGTSFDFYDEASHHDSNLVTEQQKAMRKLLRETMEKHGFKALDQEWWHYSLEKEPYPNTYFDFIIH